MFVILTLIAGYRVSAACDGKSRYAASIDQWRFTNPRLSIILSATMDSPERLSCNSEYYDLSTISLIKTVLGLASGIISLGMYECIIEMRFKEVGITMSIRLRYSIALMLWNCILSIARNSASSFLWSLGPYTEFNHKSDTARRCVYHYTSTFVMGEDSDL